MRDRAEFFRKVSKEAPALINMKLTLGTHETGQAYAYTERETALRVASKNADNVKEQQLIRQFFDAGIIFPQLLIGAFVPYPNCLVILEATRESLNPQLDRKTK